MDKVVIFGVGQIAELAYFYLTNDSSHKIIAFTVDKEYLAKVKFKGLPVVPFEDIENIYAPEEAKLFMPISYKKVNKIRADRYLKAKEKGYSFISYISPRSTYYNTPVGENCFIFENNVIQPFTEIGNNVIMWSGNHLGHHSKIGDHCFIASHVVVSGGVVIKPYCFIGVNATIRDNITVGAESVVGAGSLILQNVAPRSVISPGATPISKVLSDRLKGI